jgi:hypothetical protein
MQSNWLATRSVQVGVPHILGQLTLSSVLARRYGSLNLWSTDVYPGVSRPVN